MAAKTISTTRHRPQAGSPLTDEEAFALTARALETARTCAGFMYADVRLICQKSELLETKNSQVSAYNCGSSKGIGIRVLAGGGFGFACSQDLSFRAIANCARLAGEVALASGSVMKSPVKLAPEPAWRAHWVSPHLIDPFTVSTDAKIAVLLDSAERMLSVGGVTLAMGVLHFIEDLKYFANSDGSQIKQSFIRSGCAIEANAATAGDRQRRSYPCAFGQFELAGWEMVGSWDLPNNAERIAREAVALLSAPACPQGEIDTIIGSSQLGLQIHESMGHPCELDRALGHEINFAGASFLTPDKIHKLKYGSDMFNMVAEATASGALGSFGFDDEGVQAQRVDLVKGWHLRGILKLPRYRPFNWPAPLGRGHARRKLASCAHYSYDQYLHCALPHRRLPAGPDRGHPRRPFYMETNKSWSIDSMRYNFQFSTEIGSGNQKR